MKNEKELNQAVRPAVRQTLYAPTPCKWWHISGLRKCNLFRV